MRVAIVIDGPSKKTLAFIENYSENTRQAIRQTFFHMGNELKKKANAAILDKTTKTGRWYRVYRNGRRFWHQASAPGETHANLSGALRRSLSYQIQGTSVLEFGYGVANDMKGPPAPEYARRIEEGGYGSHKTYIAPRPSLKNAVGKVSFDKFFSKELARLESK